MSKHDREGRRLQVSVVCLASMAAPVSHPFVLSHMTCKKCKYEFCWVCMGTELCFVMGGFVWPLTVRCAYI